jgi:WD40 repeat protein
LAVSPDDKLFASTDGPRNSTVTLWDAKKLKVLDSFVGKSNASYIAFNKTGKLLASCGNQETDLWDVQKRKLLATLTSNSGEVNAVAFAPDGNVLVTACGGPAKFGHEPGKIEIWELRTMTRVQICEIGNKGIMSIAFSPDGRMIATGSYQGRIKMWEFTNP